MKRPLIAMSLSLASVGMAYSQSAIDGYRISQPDMKGTARFMSMGGAFGALGGDLSSLSQNPAGIGVYRSNDIGLTLDLDCQSATSKAQGNSYTTDQTKFLLNNVGAVFTLRLPSYTFPNFNIGFTYNKGASFNRRYAGNIPKLNTSMSNYIAGISNSNELTVGDVATVFDKNNNVTFDPYNPNDGGYAAPWLSILGYDSYLVTPFGEGVDTQWYGQWGSDTSGSGMYEVNESGSSDEYNIAIGGNIANVVYWGMNFDIVNFNYTLNSMWGESLSNAYVPNNENVVAKMNAAWNLNNYYNINGSGFNYQLGVILKPIQELRLGFAFHTPTYFNLTETFGAETNYQYGDGNKGSAITNGGQYGYNDMCFRTPWKLIGSIAGVIGSKFILSFDYEWTPYDKMKFSEAGTYGVGNGWDYGDWGYDDWGWSAPYYAPSKSNTTKSVSKPKGFELNDPYYYTNSDIATHYRSASTFRLGAEYRVTPAFSVRAGFCHVTSPFKQSVRNDQEIIYTAGTRPNYRVDNHTNYITCGLGYRYQQFYVDMAYVYKNMNSTYHAFSPDVNLDTHQSIPSPQSNLSLNNSQIVLTAGFRF
ncbi:MAG: outer membrane protein transport protein [Muribaculaceae bacterium]|nr:outer membrane protein transport protein [Muribaculaceae bacterium]